jgi:hypothetical protein
MNESKSRDVYPTRGRRCLSGALSPDCVVPTLVCDNWINGKGHKDESRLASDNYTPHKQEEPCKTHVILLRWSDAKGREAEYTGQVNEFIRPNGLGCLVYKDGTAFTSIWSNGTPVGLSSYQAKPQLASSMPQDPHGFKLGDVARPQDMHIDPNPQMAHDRAASLRLNSFAFVLRSTGDWTYAIVSDGSNQSGPEASIKFVVDTRGRTKTIKARHWSRYIRLVNAETQDFKKNTSKISETKAKMKKSSSDYELARLTSFHRSVKNTSKKSETKAKMKKSSSDNELARLTSFHRAVRRVSIDMSSRQYKNSDLGGSEMW